MDAEKLEQILTQVRDGGISVREGLERLATLPVVDLGHTRLDTHRSLRCGAAEVIFGEGKTPTELVEIAGAHRDAHARLLVTRADPGGSAALVRAFPGARVFERARAVAIGLPAAEEGQGLVLVVSAGTADGAAAEEAALTARMLGARVESLVDVGVAGVHRLLEHTEKLRSARVLVVVAGMEGALASVVGGLVEQPVVALPTSVGYGTGLGGFASLLSMLNSCAAGVTVVNIDNGFGAGYAAARINRMQGTD